MTIKQAQNLIPGDHFKIFPALDAMEQIDSVSQESLNQARNYFSKLSVSGVFTVADNRSGDGVVYVTADTGEEWSLPADIPLIIVEDLDSHENF